MKCFATLFLLVLVLSSHGQTYPSPEFTNEPSYYDTTAHSLVDLEKSHYNKLSQAKGLWGKETGFFLPHAKSSARFKAVPALRFIVMVAPGGNPSSIFDFTAFEVRDDQRVLITNKLSNAGTKSTTSVERLSFAQKKVGEGIYLLTVTNLAPGEYLFGSHDNMFAFGIDN
jgi:hypothetical protein